MPYMGDSKRAVDEYTSEIMMGGRNTLVLHNTCEDSLLASPIILDLVILSKMCQRVTFKVAGDAGYQQFNSVLSLLSYLCKVPLIQRVTPLVNALFRQRACIENIFCACVDLAPINHMLLEHKHIAHVQPQAEAAILKAKQKGNVLTNGASNGHVVAAGGSDSEGAEM